MYTMVYLVVIAVFCCCMSSAMCIYVRGDQEGHQVGGMAFSSWRSSAGQTSPQLCLPFEHTML